MRLFWMEVKKIFSWKLLLLIGLVNLLLFEVLLSFELEYFPNGHPATEIFEVEKQIIREYGGEINQNEFEEIKVLYAEQVKAADDFFAEDTQAQELGISNYEEFRTTNPSSSKLRDYRSNLMAENEGDFLWYLQARHSLIENYEAQETFLELRIEENTGSRQAYFEERLSENQFSFYSSLVLDNFRNYKTNMAIIVLISIALLMSPVFLRDYQSGMLPIQYTSKKGRHIYRAKWFAGTFSAAVLTAFLLAVYMGLYWANDTSSHFDLPLTSMGWYDFWYDLTFIQYVLLSIAGIFFVAVLLGILSMALSTIAPNAIVLIGIQIIIMFIMIAGVVRYLVRDIIDLWLPQVLVPGGYIVLTAVILISSGLIWKRELRKDIL